MRAWPKILLSALLLASLPLPTAAHSSKHQVVISSGGRVRFVSHPFMSSFFPLTNGVLFPNGTFARSRFGRFGQFGTAFPWDFGGWDYGGGYTPVDTSPRLVVLNAGAPGTPPALPTRSAVDDRPTVETTPSGVQIVRGPGSHHLSRY
jgi:hypothetical protein